jgi:hypothetical protein
LSERSVALGDCGANDGAKYFVVDQVWNDRAAASRLNQLLVDCLVLVAPAFFQRVVIVAGHFVFIFVFVFIFILVYCHVIH